MMRCELCGKETNATRPAYIEGSKLSVCQNCVRFSDEFKGSRSKGSSVPAPSLSVIEERLERRQRRMKSKDVYATETKELVVGYADLIKEARRKRDWDQEKLAKALNEKKSVITKVESGSLTPSDDLVKKLEKALEIKLTETVMSSGGQKGSGSGNRMTLGDFIRRE
jgi:putative transcription factor